MQLCTKKKNLMRGSPDIASWTHARTNERESIGPSANAKRPKNVCVCMYVCMYVRNLRSQCIVIHVFYKKLGSNLKKNRILTKKIQTYFVLNNFSPKSPSKHPLRARRRARMTKIEPAALQVSETSHKVEKCPPNPPPAS